MNVRLLKAKRVEKNLYQKDLAKALNITEKAMSQKECSPVNKFKADEMVTIAKTLNLSFSEFDAIFFDHKLTECLRRQQKVSGCSPGVRPANRMRNKKDASYPINLAEDPDTKRPSPRSSYHT